MAYTPQTGAPQGAYQGRTFTIAAITLEAPVGELFVCAVMELKADGWNEVGSFTLNLLSDQLLELIATHGGIMPFMTWLVQSLNASLATLFSTATPTPTGEPSTYPDALAAIQALLAQHKLTVVNGQLVLTR